MELSPKDRKSLFGGKWKIFTIFARKRALKRVNELVEEADRLLATYPPVDYDNFGVAINADAQKVAIELFTDIKADC